MSLKQVFLKCILILSSYLGRGIAQTVGRRFPPRRSGFEPRSNHVEFVVDKGELRQVFSEYVGFSCQFSSHRLLHIHHYLSSGTGTVGQLVVDVTSGLTVSTHPKKLKKKTRYPLVFLLTPKISTFPTKLCISTP
jgi:hypothetical protein